MTRMTCDAAITNPTFTGCPKRCTAQSSTRTETQCDAAAANALLTHDVEFYDDRTGLTSGDEVREGFERLVGNCPAGNGVRRVLLPNTLEVYPIHGVGALQTGIHHFVERGASNSTIAKFYVVWLNDNGSWKMSRIMSVDHRIVDASHTADLRRHPSP